MRWILAGILSELLLTCSLAAQLRVDEQWLRLMHYRKGWGTAYQSSLANPEFFLSSQGRSDPEAEWSRAEADLSLTTVNLRGHPVEPRCAFPARALYFKRLGRLPAGNRPCPAFEAFRAQLNLRSISLVFSTAYAGNSASMFGHTLLKLNRIDSASGRGLLDFGVAFLALSDPGDGALYALKGLFGGYPGFYTIQPYYELVNQYAYNENRDLWELEIPLDELEKELLIAHLWELRQEASAPYFFTHVNCAAMLAELIDVVKPNWRIRAALHGFIMPSELMRETAERVAPKIDLTFRPSQRRRWLKRLGDMNEKELSDYHRAWSSQSLDGMAADSRVLDALLDRVTKEKSRLPLAEQKSVRDFEQSLLFERSYFKTPATVLDAPGENNPIAAHGPLLLGLSAGAQETQAMTGLRLRTGWHDLLDRPDGFEPWYHLNYFNLVVHKQVESSKLLDGDLTLAEVGSFMPFSLDEKLYSWTLGGGLRYLDDHRSLYVRSSGGLSATFDRWLFSALPGLEVGEDFTDRVLTGKLSLRLQTLARWTPNYRSLLIIEPSIDDGKNRYVDASLEIRANLSKNWQLQLKGERRADANRWEVGGLWNN